MTGSNILQKICALLCAFPSHQNHIYTDLPPTASEQSLGAIWGAISRAIVLILPQIKLDSQPSPCAFLKVSSVLRLRKWGEILNFPGGSDGKASAYNAGDLGSIPGLGRSPGEANGNLFQYFCWENPMDRGAWGAIGYGL